MANGQQARRNLRIGVVVGLSLLALMTFLFFIGSEDKMFSKKNEYKVLLESAAGLAEGNPVQMSGVTIGTVKDIFLPRDPKNRTVTILISVQQKYGERVRLDSRAKLRKLGLIAADSYIDITPGSPTQPVLAPGSIIPAHKATDVDKLLSSGEDLVDNFVQISYSLKNILGRVDRGEGLLGELTTNPEKKQRITDTFLATLNRTNALLDHVKSGNGLMGKLIYDDQYSVRLSASIESSASSLQSILGNVQRGFESGEGALPALLNEPSGRRNVTALIDNLRITSENLALISQEMKSGEGIVPRLMSDKEFADTTLDEFRVLVRRLNETARKLNEGEGTAGRLIADPGIYEAVNDILIGINESKLLRWLIRNRQQKGIDTRYRGESGRKSPPAPESTQPVEEPPPPPPVELPQPAPATTPAAVPAEGTAAPPSTDTAAPAQPPADSVATDTTSTSAPEGAVTTTTNP